MSKNKLSNEELQTLKDYQVQINELVGGMGVVELRIYDLEEQKDKILENYSKIKNDQNKFGQELQKKYGEGNIDLESGEITATK
jgi:hypothetical protein|tara:strand:- start:483 stop:734 length:252 start_codon:yes stop_codon:yes gene_type:complete